MNELKNIPKQHRPCPKLAVVTCNFPRMDVLRDEKKINPSISILLLRIHELWSWCSQPTPPRQERCLMLLDTKRPIKRYQDITQWSSQPVYVSQWGYGLAAISKELFQDVPQWSFLNDFHLGLLDHCYTAMNFHRKINPSDWAVAAKPYVIPFNSGWLRTGFPVHGFWSSPIINQPRVQKGLAANSFWRLEHCNA